MIQLLATILLAIIFTPGVMYKIPKKVSFLTVACIHAFLFTIVYLILQPYIRGINMEGFEIEDRGSKPKNEKEEKISEILSKLSVEKTKELSNLSSEQMEALTKLINSMEPDEMETFVDMSVDKIKEMIDDAL